MIYPKAGSGVLLRSCMYYVRPQQADIQQGTMAGARLDGTMGGKQIYGDAGLLLQHHYNADNRGSIKSKLLSGHSILSGISVVVEQTQV